MTVSCSIAKGNLTVPANIRQMGYEASLMLRHSPAGSETDISMYLNLRDSVNSDSDERFRFVLQHTLVISVLR